MNKEANSVENDESDDGIDEAENSNFADTIVMTEEPVTDGGADTAELRVDKLIAQVEAQNDADVLRKKKVRQRLEELSEEMSMEDTFAFDVEDAD